MKTQIQKITEHIQIINTELGRVQTDIKWIKYVIYYMATVITAYLIQGVYNGMV